MKKMLGLLRSRRGSLMKLGDALCVVPVRLGRPQLEIAVLQGSM
jgi:hypothetical protein